MTQKLMRIMRSDDPVECIVGVGTYIGLTLVAAGMAALAFTS